MCPWPSDRCSECLAILTPEGVCRLCGWVAPPRPKHEAREVPIAGLDLGQLQDHTVFIRGVYRMDEEGEAALEVQSLHRFPLYTSYLVIAQKVAAWMSSPPWDKAELATDQTGVGGGVVEMIEAAGVKNVTPITITAGRAVSRGPGGSWHVAKLELVSTLQRLLSRRALHLPEDLPDLGVLQKELLSFREKITLQGNSTFEADWRREGSHDDAVLAICLAAFVAERSVGTNFNIVPLDLKIPPPAPYQSPFGKAATPEAALPASESKPAPTLSPGRNRIIPTSRGPQ